MAEDAGPHAAPPPGAQLELTVGKVAHGGHFVARHEGQVVFVRHALPGERVRALVTETRGRYLLADAVEVLEPAAERVTPPCPYAGPGRCGGCDFQHVDLDHQRQLKAAVVREQLQRLAGLDRPVVVEPLPGDADGLRWRTRAEFAVSPAGRAGLRRHRSHEVVELDDCLIAVAGVVGTGVLARDWTGTRAVDVVAPSAGSPVLVPLPGGAEAPDVVETVTSPAFTGTFRVSARGFWQVHPGAAETFVQHVLDTLRPAAGERALDLYAGVGLFARALAEAVGRHGAVTAVEADPGAVRDAQHNLADVRQARVRRGRVDRLVGEMATRGQRVDLVVLDPPRTGAGKAVVRDLLALRPRAVAYLACDPAALARDLGYATAAGYRLDTLRAFDAFPMTHHVECIAVLRP